MIAKFFIERPVLANVIALLIVILGIVALYTLPVAQYPDVVPPTVQVTARYPGASAATVTREVALPIEQRPVQVGDLVDGGLRIIDSGLLPNERVVVGGLMRALPGNTVVPVTTSASAATAGTDGQ